MRKVDLLRELQELDSALDRARESLEECRAGLGDDSELVPLRDDRERARRAHRSLQEKGRDLDWELENATDKLKADEKKLYGGTIKNPKELSGLDQEVRGERERVSRLETQVLLNMDALEEAAAAVAAAESALAEREKDWKARQSELEARCAALAGQVESLTPRRAEVASRVDPASLRLYENLRRTRGGLAVVAIEQRACQGCRISLSSAEVQRARSSVEPVTCQSCGRILYLPL